MTRKFYNNLLLVILIFLILISPLVINFGKTGKNTKIIDQDYSLLNKSQIISKLNTDFTFPEIIELTTKNRTFPLNLKEIKVSVSPSRQANQLLFRRLNQGLYRYIRNFFAPRSFSLIIDYDNNTLSQSLDKIIQEIDKPFIPSELYLEKNKVKLKNGELGQKVNKVQLNTDILNILSNYQLNSPIVIPIDTIGVLPDQKAITDTMDLANKIVSKSVILNSEEQKLTITPDMLISWLEFNGSFKSDKIDSYINDISTSLEKAPIDAVFQFENGKVLEFQPSRNGYSLNKEQLKALLARNLPNLFNIKDLTITIDLPLIFTEPKISNSSVNNLGIKELLGKGTSTFKHSSEARNYNVKRGSETVNRILVIPGENFSFNKALGEVNFDTGYKTAYVIKEGRTVPGVGGGICQVSTTFFRALLDAGLDIIERSAHSYRVAYYEEDSKPGYDATVYGPKPDLRFINDTGNNILIQSTYDGVNKTLTYEIFGTSDGRKAEITNYRQWGWQSPPPDKYIDDPTLPLGKVIQDEYRVAGIKTAFDWKVTRDNQIIHEKTFTSNYVPWAAVFRRGTGQ